jgi:regulator of replication initiation timing
MFIQPFYFVSYYVYCIEYDDYFFFQETYNNRLRERYGDDILTHPEFDPNLWMEVGSSGGPDKNQVYGLSNTTADNLRSTRRVPTVGSSQSISSSQSKEFVALQQHTAQLTEKYDNLSAEYAQLKASHAQQIAEQRAESEQIKASQAQQKVEYEAAYEQQKAAYEQLREMIMNMANSGTCAPNLFWSYNHQPPPGSPPPPPAPPLY